MWLIATLTLSWLTAPLMHAVLQPAAVVVYQPARLKDSQRETYPFAPRVSVQCTVVRKKDTHAVIATALWRWRFFLLALLLFNTE